MDGLADIRHLAFAALLLLFVLVAVAVGAGAVLVLVDRVRGVRGLRVRRAAAAAPRVGTMPVPLIVGPLATFHALTTLRRPRAPKYAAARAGRQVEPRASLKPRG